MTLASASFATKNRRSRSMTWAIRTAASAALATALTAALHSSAPSAQTPEPDVGNSKAKAAEQTTDDSTVIATDDSTETTADDSTGTTAADSTAAASDAARTTAKPAPVKPKKRISKPFEPTEKIEAESVISFPANI